MDKDSSAITLRVPKDKEVELYNLIQKHPDIIPGFEIPYAYPNKQIINDSADLTDISHSKDLAEFLKVLNLGQAHLVGHSLGAIFTCIIVKRR